MKRSLLLVVTAVVRARRSVIRSGGSADEDDPDRSVLPDESDGCGSYGVTWNIDLTADIWTFRDDQGRMTKVVQHIREDNTVAEHRHRAHASGRAGELRADELLRPGRRACAS